MKRGILPNGTEVFTFGIDNTLRIFPPNTFKFKAKGHIALDEIQECILDNFWFQYNNKREEKGYLLSILNSLAEYFNMMNKNIPKSARIQTQEIISVYVLFDGSKPGIYTRFEELAKQKSIARMKGEDLTWKKYIDINEALKYAKDIIGEDFYIDPKVKEYIEKVKGKNKNTPPPPNTTHTKGESSKKAKEEEESPQTLTYKACLLKGVDPLDSEHIDLKVDQKFEEIAKTWKVELKAEILKELQAEFNEKFEELKREYDSKYDMNFLDDDHMDIAGHGQLQE
jgi:hypothetical protein